MMKKILYAVLILFCLLPLPASGGQLTADEKRKIESEVSNTFERVISLWRDENYEALYEYGDKGSREALSREKFAEKMKNNAWGLACCWQTAQDVEVTAESRALAHVKARIGYEMRFKSGNIKFIAETFAMVFQEGEWRVNLRQITYQDPWLLPQIFMIPGKQR